VLRPAAVIIRNVRCSAAPGNWAFSQLVTAVAWASRIATGPPNGSVGVDGAINFYADSVANRQPSSNARPAPHGQKHVMHYACALTVPARKIPAMGRPRGSHTTEMRWLNAVDAK
jgi:hypothetical protein